AGLDGGGGGVEAHLGGLDEDLAARFAGLGVGTGGVVGGGGLLAVCDLGEREAERHIGQRVSVAVDVEPVDRVGVEPVTLHEGVGVQDQHGPVRVIGRREDEEFGEVQACIVAGVLEVGGAEVIGHGVTPSLLMLISQSRRGYDPGSPGQGEAEAGRLARRRCGWPGHDLSRWMARKWPALWPPSTCRISPVTNSAVSRYAIASTMSLMSPIRPSGCRAASASWVSSACIGVRMMPSATVLTRMPVAAYSMASDRVTAFSPPLVSDASADGTAVLAWSTRLVEMLTTCPRRAPLLLSMAAMAGRVALKNPRRLTP